MNKVLVVRNLICLSADIFPQKFYKCIFTDFFHKETGVLVC